MKKTPPRSNSDFLTRFPEIFNPRHLENHKVAIIAKCLSCPMILESWTFFPWCTGLTSCLLSVAGWFFPASNRSRPPQLFHFHELRISLFLICFHVTLTRSLKNYYVLQKQIFICNYTLLHLKFISKYQPYFYNCILILIFEISNYSNTYAKI